MSDKTLVERMTESLTADCIESARIFGVKCDDQKDCSDCERAVFSAIFDAIEREYLPRPRFEDGEPVQFGDEYETEFGETGTVKLFCFTDIGEYRFSNGEHWNSSTRVLKHPKAEVLDADGVPIRKGDTVYATRYGYVECIVLSIEWVCDGWLVEVENCTGHKFRQTPDEFVHKQPDSLERIEADAKKVVCDYFGSSWSDCDNCRSLRMNCGAEMALDLLRRQREVLERGHER